MTILAPPSIESGRMTPADFEQWVGETTHELIDGRPVEIAPMGLDANEIVMRLAVFLWSRLAVKGWARVTTIEVGYRCFPHDRNRVRKPDLAVVSTKRCPNPPANGYLDVVPDLVVEVVSSNDLYDEVMARVDDFLRAGTPEVWVILPSLRQVAIHRPGVNTITVHSENDTLLDLPLLPGANLPLRSLFETMSSPAT
jgi:Uma2 family endonuclease